ncbi:MAG: hypothetical protein JRE82_01545 [Deltaproteobacteria bacterium]|nr:hypothetical protein [Deltaproteobacteria bacterium]
MNCFSFSALGAHFLPFLVSALMALFVVGCGSSNSGTGGSAGAGGSGGTGGAERLEPIREAIPMPRQTAEELGIEPFVGTAVVSNPTNPKDIPPHPFLNNGGDSRIHNDHYNSATYNREGPAGPSLEIVTAQSGIIAGVCPMMAILESGYVIASCLVASDTTGLQITLTMFDNENLDVVAERELGLKPFVTNAAGGAYFSMDKDENIIIGPPTNRLEQYHVEVVDRVAQFVQDYSKEIPGLPPAVEVDDPMLQDTVVDYEGRIWFMVTDGRVGYYDVESDTTEMTDLEQELQNSMVVDDRGVYLVTYESTFRLSVAENGPVQVDWEAPYDPGSGISGVLPGSGTSPTLLGTRDDLISIADNADGQINLLVMDRDQPNPPLCKLPVFREGESATENTVVAYDDDIVIVNNSGFGGPFAPARTMNPGIERYRVLRDNDGNVTGCENVWKNTTSFGNSAQLTTGSGVIWGWGADPDVTGMDLFYLTATSWESGEEIFRTYIGDGRPFDPITGQVHLHPDGTLYMGAVQGVIAMRDAAE